MEQTPAQQGSDAHGSVAVEAPPSPAAAHEQLRPPESWPGAGGRKSVAPDVPSWPGARRGSDPGGSWPGATPPGKAGTSRKPSRSRARRPGPLDPQTVARLRENSPAHRVSRYAKGRWALRAGLYWLAPFVLACAWVVFDPEHRGAQFVLLGLIAVAAATHIVLMPRMRYRIHRWEVTDVAIYTQCGALVRNRRIAPLADVVAVHTGASPLQSIFGLGTITVTTSGGRVRIADLSRRAVRDVAATIEQRASLAG